MQTVFSHIIQKRFSGVNEDVATDALSFLIDNYDGANNSIQKLLTSIVPEMPPLIFKTQQAEGSIRPDMWGYEDATPRVLIENKFWAGLTDNQPVAYLKKLASCPQPSTLLFIAPAAREHTLWRELCRRLLDANISFTEAESSSGVAHTMGTELGPMLAIATWSSVIALLEQECINNPAAIGDLAQLKALCLAADLDAYLPLSSEVLTDQRTPALIMQLFNIVQSATDLAVSENVVYVKDLRPQASWDRTGRYVRLSGPNGLVTWFGVHFVLWKQTGETPFWLYFHDGFYRNAKQIRQLIEPWAKINNQLIADINNGDLAVGLAVPYQTEKSEVIRVLVDKIAEIGNIVEALEPLPADISKVSSEEDNNE